MRVRTHVPVVQCEWCRWAAVTAVSISTTPPRGPMPLTTSVSRSLRVTLLLATPLFTSCTKAHEPVVATPGNATVTVDVIGGFTP